MAPCPTTTLDRYRLWIVVGACGHHRPTWRSRPRTTFFGFCSAGRRNGVRHRLLSRQSPLWAGGTLFLAPDCAHVSNLGGGRTGRRLATVKCYFGSALSICHVPLGDDAFPRTGF